MAAPVDDRALLEIFEWGLDDWITFETVAGILSRLVKPPRESLCAETGRCISILVDAGWFRAGVMDVSKGFVELTRPLPDALADVCDGWSLTDPTTWDALWLELTEQGRAEALRSFPELSQDAGTFLDRRVLFEVFAPALDDRVSLGTVADVLRDHFAVSGVELWVEVRRFVIGVVVEGWFRPGTMEDTRFALLTAPLDELLAALGERWGGADQDRWGSAVWLELTNAGRVEALRRFPSLAG